MLVDPIKIRIDYQAKRVDFHKVFFGDGTYGSNFAELLNLFNLEDSEIHLGQISIGGVQGISRLIESVIVAWLPKINKSWTKNEEQNE